jgi:hypothetical protein
MAVLKMRYYITSATASDFLSYVWCEKDHLPSLSLTEPVRSAKGKVRCQCGRPLGVIKETPPATQAHQETGTGIQCQ